ncbi:MAG: hypothetical protein A2622_07990 [Bdellovibrionales bacterium RIFCSPHIGHO2_01_FULL_40_29]|nr:MAG: hypothetical protein A2622_07990 [Bdellovibrionales bacterium RIFCSPHIGHO2_01_FULL_40_29]OFZ33044.1 MAG: hypothetical protein A3D17_07965 [Bdellovibrionales bacterium RIFCSPHIGHO2_02_FULL_40_15]
MVDRYKKSGGFVQLLQVLETCGPKKYDQFMNIISEEDPNWAAAIKEKMLTFEKILNWKPEVLLEVLANVNPLAFCTAIKGLSPEAQNNFLSGLSHQEKRKLENQIEDLKPTPVEISSCVMKVISETRTLLTSGVLKAAKIDQSLVIPESFEEKLSAKGSASVLDSMLSDDLSLASQPSGGSHHSAPSTHGGFAAGSNGSAELEKLQKKLVLVTRELQTMKQENSVLKDKLEKIKKIA